MHRDTQCILGDNDIYFKLFDELVKPALEIVSHCMDVATDLRGAMFDTEGMLVDPADFLMIKKGLGHQHAHIRIPVQLPGKPVGNMPTIPQKLGPFGRL